MWKKLLGVNKLKSMYKKRKVHGEEYWMFKYYQSLCFKSSCYHFRCDHGSSSSQKLAIFLVINATTVLIHEDVSKACLKSFIFSK